MITTTRADTLSGRFFFLFVSIFLNAFSNALTVSTNMGSAIWTASAVNLSHWVHLSLGNAFFWRGSWLPWPTSFYWGVLTTSV